MAKKSKAYKELLRWQKKSPDDNLNISETFESFIEPWIELTETEESMRRLLKLAIIAWNTSISSQSKEREMTVQPLVNNIDEENPKIKADIEDFINRLIIRKNRDFSQYKQFIIDFNLKDLGDTYQISITSISDN